jgi:signal transduction histidine kinase
MKAKIRLAPWEDLGPWARVSLAGVIAAGLLAVGLGWFIPREVERRFLDAQMEADRSVLDFLTATQALVTPHEPDVAALDAFTGGAILRGDYVRVKLWRDDGTIVYSDAAGLIGRSFPLEEDLRTVFATGEAVSSVSDLSADENIEERALGSALLETYLPVESAGDVIAVWEVYRSLDGLQGAVAGVRGAVWLSVGSGLVVLALFMVSSFGNMTAVIQRRRKEAEARSSDLETFLAVARTTSRNLDPREVAAEAVEIVHRTGGFHCVALLHEPNNGGEATLVTVAGDGICLEAAGGQPTPGCLAAEARTRTVDGTFRLVTCSQVGGGHIDERTHLLSGAVEEIRLGVERAELVRDLERSRAQLRTVMDRLVTAQEEERKRIVGDVHDGLGQDLHRVLYGIRGCLDASPTDVDAELRRLEILVASSSHKLRRLIHDLHPSVIEDVGLAGSLRGLVDGVREQWGLRSRLVMAPFDEPPVGTRLAAYRVTQEALRNVARHSGVSECDVTVGSQDGEIVIRVSDNGRGMSNATRSSGLGMWLMRDRAEMVGGSRKVKSAEGGTVVEARFPQGET